MAATLQNRPSGTMTGGRALAEMLHLAGAGPMFGMGGFQLLPFYDAIGPGRAQPSPDQRRALRRLCRRRLCPRHQPARHLRRHARPRRDQPRHRARRVAERRHPDRRDNRRHQSRAFLEEHDPGKPPGRNSQAGGQGADPGRDDQPHPRAGPARVRGGDLGPAGAGVARRARGCLPRHARFCPRGLRHRRDHAEGAGPAHPPRPCRYRTCREADRQGKTAAIADRRRDSPVRGMGGVDPIRRGAVDPGRAHDERQRWHRLRQLAQCRAFWSLFAHRQRFDRGVGLPDRGRLQARRDRHQALRAAAGAYPRHPSRDRRRGNRPLHPGRDRAVGRCARRARGPRGGLIR